MKKRIISAKQTGRVAAVVLIIAMLMSLMLMPAYAVNEKVQATANGVLQFNMVYRDDYGNEIALATGSCFLINENTVVTCAHCVTLDEYDIEAIAEYLEKTTDDIRNHLGYSVTVARDVTMKATIRTVSHEVDFAILTLDSSLVNKTPLTLRHSNDAEATMEAYAVAFPAQVADVQMVAKYTSDDITITNGQVTNPKMTTAVFNGTPADYILTNCQLTGGSSGGPLVDENGYVMGICAAHTGEVFSADYYYAVSIDQVRIVLDSLGIAYTDASEPAPVETEPVNTQPVETEPAKETVNTSDLDALLEKVNGLKEEEFTPTSFSAVKDKLEAAKNAALSGSQETVDKAKKDLQEAVDKLEKAKGSNLLLLIIIAAVAVLAIVIVVILVAASSKKKKAKKAAQAPAQPAGMGRPMGQAPGMAPPGFAPTPMAPAPQRSGTAPLSGEAGATTVLTQGAGETTVLSKKVNGGVLVRRKNGEQVNINLEEFVIGRERKRVSYCISDNSSVGRAHAKFVVRNGITFLVDMNSTNGTFVNGVRATPNQEIPLKTGDKITLADDDFDYRA